MAIEIDLGVLLAIVIPIGTVCILSLLVLACVVCIMSRSGRRRLLCGSRNKDPVRMSSDPPKLSVDIDNEPRLSQLNQLYGPQSKQSSVRQSQIKRVSGQRTSRPEAKLGPIAETPKSQSWQESNISPPAQAVNRQSAKLYGQPQIHSVENCARIDYTSGIESISASIVTDPSERHASLISIQQTPKSVCSPAPTQYFTPTRPERPERPEPLESAPEPAAEQMTQLGQSQRYEMIPVRLPSSDYSSPVPPAALWSQRDSSHSGSEHGNSISTICDKPLPQLPAPSSGGIVADLDGAMFKAIFAYTPVLYDELALKQGDMVRCHQVFDDGWCMASRVETSERGICPRACLAEV